MFWPEIAACVSHHNQLSEKHLVLSRLTGLEKLSSKHSGVSSSGISLENVFCSLFPLHGEVKYLSSYISKVELHLFSGSQT